MQDRQHVLLKNVTFYRAERRIFSSVNIPVQRHKITAIMGPSGAGKTTLLRLVGGLIQPDSGSVMLNGEDIHGLSQPKLFKARQRMGMLFQNAALFNQYTVFENVAYPLREHLNLPETILRNMVLMKLEESILKRQRVLTSRGLRSLALIVGVLVLLLVLLG